ncbi:MAG: hypothetical protein EOP38_10860 [Rubrivivax sp.]|nr:MAG: hypothetical protein EOP38_10860 [Rubrivivax sp.]
MKLDIDHIAITLQGVSPDLGGRVSDLLSGTLSRQLSGLKLRTASSAIAQADLGPIEAPAGADAQAITDLIAARLLGWLDQQEDH